MTDTGKRSTRKWGTRPLVVRVVGLVILVVIVSVLWWRFGPVAERILDKESASGLWGRIVSGGSRNGNQNKILATGTIEATEVDISSEIGGQIENLTVDEGDRVEKDELIAKIESSQIEAEVSRAEAALEGARARLGDLEAGSRLEELERARAQVELAEASLELATSEWKRAESLYEEGVFSANQRDNARTSRDVAKKRYDAAVDELNLMEAGSRPDQIKAARWQVKEAEAALRLANVRLEKSQVYASISGVVLVKSSERGEIVSPGVPIVTVADLDDMWVKIYVDEVDVGKIRLGQPAAVRVDSFPDRTFSGKVTYISSEAEFTPKNIQTREDRVKLVFAVKVGVDNAGGLLKPGMYADIELEELSPESPGS